MERDDFGFGSWDWSSVTPPVGYFDSPDQDTPTYDPPLECIVCGRELTAKNARTISVMAMPDTHPTRSYFYRLHRTCHDDLTPEEQGALDTWMLNTYPVKA